MHIASITIYISYFAGDNLSRAEKSKNNALTNSLGFVLGFTVIFTLLGGLAGSLGTLIKRQSIILNILSGIIIIVFGLNYIGVIKIGFLEKTLKLNIKIKSFKFFSSVLFGIIFAIGWTPCIGTFLGAALMIAVNSGHIIKGIIMLLIYSLGLGIPFVICAVLIDNLKDTFNLIKKNYSIINYVSGVMLVIIGISIMTGYLNRILSLFRF